MYSLCPSWDSPCNPGTASLGFLPPPHAVGTCRLGSWLVPLCLQPQRSTWHPGGAQKSLLMNGGVAPMAAELQRPAVKQASSFPSLSLDELSCKNGQQSLPHRLSQGVGERTQETRSAKYLVCSTAHNQAALLWQVITGSGLPHPRLCCLGLSKNHLDPHRLHYRRPTSLSQRGTLSRASCIPLTVYVAT